MAVLCVKSITDCNTQINNRTEMQSSKCGALSPQPKSPGSARTSAYFNPHISSARQRAPNGENQSHCLHIKQPRINERALCFRRGTSKSKVDGFQSPILTAPATNDTRFRSFINRTAQPRRSNAITAHDRRILIYMPHFFFSLPAYP